MILSDARAMVAQFAWHATPAQRDIIARHMVATDVCALHAAWEMFGRVKGMPCFCTPCLLGPPIGSEVVIKILLQGRAPEEVNPAQ